MAGAAAPLVTARNITLGAGGGTFDTVDLSMTIAGDISGSGALTKSGERDLVLLGNNTYSGGTFVTGGTLALGDATNTATIIGDALARILRLLEGDLGCSG